MILFGKKINGDKTEMIWSDFYQNFCSYFKVYFQSNSNSYNSFKFAFVNKNVVTADSFCTALFWLTDNFTYSWGMIKTFVENVQFKWFWAKATTQTEEQLVQRKKEFLARYSVKSNGYIIAFLKGKNKISRLRVDNPYILKKRVKEIQKKHTLRPINTKKEVGDVDEDDIDLEIHDTENREFYQIKDIAKLIY